MLRVLTSTAVSSRLDVISRAALGLLQARTGTGSYPYSSSAPESHENFIGAYTPVTKKLWEERFAWSDSKQKQHTQQQVSSNSSKSDASSSSKPPEVTQVSYAFTTNHTLVELVSQLDEIGVQAACALAWVMCILHGDTGVCTLHSTTTTTPAAVSSPLPPTHWLSLPAAVQEPLGLCAHRPRVGGPGQPGRQHRLRALVW
jgi:hypothetical protein